jgi:TRAP-type C4-dicarboxylate transport system permease small subunit
VSVAPTSWIARAERWGRCLETAVVTLLLSGLIILASYQILLRNVFSSGLEWGDELVRLTVLWLALVGAVAASRENKQIKIDILSRMLSGRANVAARVTTNLFTAAVTGLLAWHSWRFVQESRLYGDTLLTDVPAWILQLILPVGFMLICYRYLLRVFRDLAGEYQ